MNMDYPIDLVYLWVDGADTEWLQRKNTFLQAADDAEHKTSVPERWQDNNELLFSLRSAEQFAPWINHIYLVTDQQRPKWLKENHPKLTVVDHRDFIPEKYLPCFAADVIESFIPCIPGLSEHFLYANDDMFFGRPVAPGRFFDSKGNPKALVKKLYHKDFVGDKQLTEELLNNIWYASRVRANLLVSRMFSTKLNWEGGHVIDGYRKSYMLEALAEPAFAEAFENTRNHRFRSPDAVQRIIFSLYDACKKRTKLIDIKHFKELKRLFCPWKLPMYISRKDDLKKIQCLRPELFCYYVGVEGYVEELQRFFQTYFPNKSSFEK